MPGETESVKWTLTGSKWVSESSLAWKDKVSSFTFCAFYPYGEGTATCDNIPMPDLSKQQGTLAGLGTFDFLSARCQTSYKETDNGTVSLRELLLFSMCTVWCPLPLKRFAYRECVAK